MAKLIMFSIRDDVVGAFNRPYCMLSRGQAVRSFQDEVTRPDDNNPMYKHPADYAMYQLGEFDEESGKISLFEVPELIIRGSDCVK